MVDIALEPVHADVSRWKARCLGALEANEQFTERAKGRVGDLARLLGRLARALPVDDSHAQTIRELSQLSQALGRQPFDDSLNRAIRSGYEHLLNVISAQEGEQAKLQRALNEAVQELEPLARTWLLSRRLKKFRKSLQGKQCTAPSEWVSELKELQKSTLKPLHDRVNVEQAHQPEPQLESQSKTHIEAKSEAEYYLTNNETTQTVDPLADTIVNKTAPQADWPAVQQVILRLLERVETVTATREKLQQLHEQVVSGIDEARLIPVLEQVRDLFDASMLGLHGEYRLFLDAVDQRLGGLLSNLERVQTRGREGLQRRHGFSEQLETQFAAIREQAQNANDLGSLKSSIENNIQDLSQILIDFGTDSDADASQDSAELEALRNRLSELESESQLARHQLEQQRCLALTDSLTGLANRRAWDERIEHEFAQWQRYSTPLSFAVLDIDYFKKVNDEHGHCGGDQALVLIANIIKNRIRQVDFAARFGGEEFVILMPNSKAGAAAEMLEHLRAFIEDCGFNYQGRHVPLTMSFGYTEVRDGDDISTVLKRADGALYDAKERGRNRVCFA